MKKYSYRDLANFSPSLAYDDVLLVPTFSSIRSRLEPETTTTVAGKNLTIPIVSSPMDTITDHKMASVLGRLGASGIIHRFLSVEDQLSQIAKLLDEKAKTNQFNSEKIIVAPAIGVGREGLYRFEKIWREFGTSLDWVAIDIANGHSSLMLETLSYVKSKVGSSVGIVAGNVATGEGFKCLAEAGADAIRVGIGGGSICKTRIMTGFGIPTLTSVADCYREKQKSNLYSHVSIIADGGIRNPADMVKSIVAGADCVMVGRVFAATKESPGEVFKSANGKMYKVYRGMASAEVQIDTKNGLKPGTCAEGVSTTIPYKGSVEPISMEFLGGLRSAMTYANAKNILELRENTMFTHITGSGLDESHAFGTKK